MDKPANVAVGQRWRCKQNGEEVVITGVRPAGSCPVEFTWQGHHAGLKGAWESDMNDFVLVAQSPGFGPQPASDAGTFSNALGPNFMQPTAESLQQAIKELDCLMAKQR